MDLVEKFQKVLVLLAIVGRVAIGPISDISVVAFPNEPLVALAIVIEPMLEVQLVGFIEWATR